MLHHHLFQVISDSLCVAGEHGGLVHHSNSLQVFFNWKTFWVLSFEFGIKLFTSFFAGYILRQFFCLLHVFHHHWWRIDSCVRKSSSCFFMIRFAMNNDADIFFGDGFTSVPHFFYKRAGGVIFFNLYTDFF